MSCPSRSTWTLSQHLNISSSLWEMNTMPRPFLFSVLMTSNRCSVSSVVNDEVGSSMRITFASEESALAISTSCREAIERCRNSVFGLMVKPNLSSSCFAFLNNCP